MVVAREDEYMAAEMAKLRETRASAAIAAAEAHRQMQLAQKMQQSALEAANNVKASLKRQQEAYSIWSNAQAASEARKATNWELQQKVADANEFLVKCTVDHEEALQARAKAEGDRCFQKRKSEVATRLLTAAQQELERRCTVAMNSKHEVVQAHVPQEGDGCLALTPGQRVLVVYVGSALKGDAGWLYGSIVQAKGNKGWFPLSAVQTSDEHTSPPKGGVLPSAERRLKKHTVAVYDKVEVLANYCHSSESPADTGYLNLKSGDYVEVLYACPEGFWLFGKIEKSHNPEYNAMSGWFPVRVTTSDW
jgi:hypothetical protein